jgi:threonine synthase
MAYLGEGNTPLIESKYLGDTLGLKNLYFKLENLNPTGSYKDRFASSAVLDMQKHGKSICFATSSGNAGASLSAYCAASGIRCIILVVDGITSSKTNQMLSYGAELFEIHDFGKDTKITEKTFDTIKAISEEGNISLQISAYKYSPYGMSGVEYISDELVETINEIDHVFVPAGGGGLILALANGFEKLKNCGKIRCFPRIHCVQPSGNDTMASSIRNKIINNKINKSKTKISGLQVPNLIDANAVIKKLIYYNGIGHLVSDTKIFKIQQSLASKEGIFCEPAGATSVAGLFRAVENKEVEINDNIVCLITGSGFKDPESLKCMIKSGKHNRIHSNGLPQSLKNIF